MNITSETKPGEITDQEIAALFSNDFLWGAATASYQIEGAAHEDGRAPSTWDYFASLPGKVHGGENGDVAADHYHRMPEDVALMARLGLKSYRFSIAWPRVLPGGTGAVNAPGLDFYDRLVDALLEKQIIPAATLYHWDLPMALHERGGWLSRETAYAFADYAEVVARKLGDRVDWWITENEPWCNAVLGYGDGIMAPGLADKQMAVTAAHHMLLGHGLAMPRLRAFTRPQAKLGITLNMTHIYALDDDPLTQQTLEENDIVRNRWMLDPLFRGYYPERLFSLLNVQPPPIEEGDLAIIAAPMDFVGHNYYSRTLILADKSSYGTGPFVVENDEIVPAAKDSKFTAMNWEVYPQGLTDLLVRIQRDYAPPMQLITESGAAFNDVWDGGERISDPERLQYLREHIYATGRAIAQGVPVQGYYVWSLMDNYEWAEGYSKRFGLVYIDYPTQRRIIKDSGYWYADFLAALRS